MKVIAILVILGMTLFGGGSAYAMEVAGMEDILPLTAQEQELIQQQCEQYDLSNELVLGIILANLNGSDHNGQDQRYGLMGLPMDSYHWISEQMGIQDIDPEQSEQSLKSGIWYLNYLREYWLAEDYSDESIVSLLLVSYQKDVAITEQWLEENEWQDDYVNQVLSYKFYLESGIIDGDVEQW